MNKITEKRIYQVLNDFKLIQHKIRIIKLLIENEELTVNQICDNFSIKQPTISHHLSKLQKTGLVSFKKRGKFSYFYIDEKKYSEFISKLEMF
jgi:ArsR family transcriptional regulator